MSATVFLGGGRITAALLAGLRLAGYKHPIIVHDRNPEKLQTLRKLYKVSTEAALPDAVARAELLILAVRPGSVRGILCDIGKVSRPLLAVSLAAGIPLATLRRGLGPPVRWARAMPSPVCRSGHGLIALAFPRGLPAGDRGRVREFFSNLGAIVQVKEAQFDAFTATYSPSHGYHVLATLAGAAENTGLDPSIALTAAAHALADAIASWREGNIPLRNLIREAATPGGIAAEVMSNMDKAGYGRLVEKALRAGVIRARTNAEQALKG